MLRSLPAASSLSQLPWVSGLQIGGPFWSGWSEAMLSGLSVKGAAVVLGTRPTTLLKRIRKHLLQADKQGSKWEVYLPDKGCRLRPPPEVLTLLGYGLS